MFRVSYQDGSGKRVQRSAGQSYGEAVVALPEATEAPSEAKSAAPLISELMLAFLDRSRVYQKPRTFKGHAARLRTTDERVRLGEGFRGYFGTYRDLHPKAT